MTPVRRKVAPASWSSSMAFLPDGVLPSGGGGMVKPMGKTFLPSMMKTMSALMVHLAQKAGAEMNAQMKNTIGNLIFCPNLAPVFCGGFRFRSGRRRRRQQHLFYH